MSYEQDIQAIKDGLEAGVITSEQAQQAIEIMKKRQPDNEIEELRKENKKLRSEIKRLQEELAIDRRIFSRGYPGYF